jgi:hypothetical protein
VAFINFKKVPDHVEVLKNSNFWNPGSGNSQRRSRLTSQVFDNPGEFRRGALGKEQIMDGQRESFLFGVLSTQKSQSTGERDLDSLAWRQGR